MLIKPSLVTVTRLHRATLKLQFSTLDCILMQGKEIRSQLHQALLLCQWHMCCVCVDVSIPGGWPGCLLPAQWPDGHNIGRWGCHVRCPSWHSAVYRFPPVTEMRGCPPLAASEATLPPLGALERWRERKKAGYGAGKRWRGRRRGNEVKRERQRGETTVSNTSCGCG